MSSPISGFTAIPNPQMLAFMPIQSYLMMYFAGSGWQYGKRRISAMSNEDFNKLTPERLLEQHSDELKRIMPTLEKSLNDVTPLVKILIEQYGDFIKAALAAVPQAIQNIGIPMLTGQAKIDYDKAFQDFLKGIIPSLPTAGAEVSNTPVYGPSFIGPQQPQPITGTNPLTGGAFSPTVSPIALPVGPVSSPAEIAEAKQEAETAKILADKQAAEVGKPYAGQTQRLARTKLEEEVAFWKKHYSNLVASPYSTGTAVSSAKQMLAAKTAALQQLILRYRW